MAFVTIPSVIGASSAIHSLHPVSKNILEKTKWHWDIWVKVLEMSINNYSLYRMQRVLEKDFECIGIDHKTLFLWQHKLLHALAQMPQPQLSGVVQIDETFIRESQKVSRNLVSHIDKKDVREPRYGYIPSKLGVMGPEFASMTTTIDNTGHCVCYVTERGRLTADIFTDLFEKHRNSPTYICTDANKIIIQLIQQNRHYDISEEDEQYIRFRKYMEQYGLLH